MDGSSLKYILLMLHCFKYYENDMEYRSTYQIVRSSFIVHLQVHTTNYYVTSLRRNDLKCILSILHYIIKCIYITGVQDNVISILNCVRSIQCSFTGHIKELSFVSDVF